jgi:hypothetical protein
MFGHDVGRTLVRYARRVAAATARDETPPDPPSVGVTPPPAPVVAGGVGGASGTDAPADEAPTGSSREAVEAPEWGGFVVLLADGDPLGRGGTLRGGPRLGATVGEAAASAATAVDPGRVPDLAVEVAVPTPPEPIAEPVVPRSVLDPGRHGVVVSRRRATGTVLPSTAVTEGLDATSVLDAACRDAGLPAGAWLEPDAEVRRFEVRTAREGPDGDVTVADRADAVRDWYGVPGESADRAGPTGRPQSTSGPGAARGGDPLARPGP